ncbi:ribosomal RNA small subunit methyltransferase NEP1-like [Diadema antillarum]|uniref:ribosomal RNA small subunit methyltransferase NEP1-like n=1 Tax=Diadema antillarum TaxID=105358 RepID=UPI003A8A37D2
MASRKHEDDDEGQRKKQRVIKTLHDKNQRKRLIVVLENASLETIKTSKGYELLNCDHHKHLMKKHKREPSDCRPDIVHQCLLMLFDSPLNRAGLLQVFVHTQRNVLIQISPQTRIPRTFDRFCGLMVQLLHKLSIHAADGPQKLLKVIKNPISDHLPVGCRKLLTSFSADKCLHPRELATEEEDPIVIVIGAMAHGKVSVDYTEGEVAVSQYPLSAALTCAKVCSGFEEAWDVESLAGT